MAAHEEPFKTDLQAIRKRARQRMEDGAVTGAYLADREQVIGVLNEVLATEIVCVLRYKNHYFMASGINAQPVAQEFLTHANEEQQHADWVAQRITQLGGTPNLNPEGLATRSHAEYVEGATLERMIREDLVAERVAIETYSEIIRWLGSDDPTTRRLIEDILKMEEEHADDLATLLQTIASRPARPRSGGGAARRRARRR
jgi:bacterioferritin